MLNLAGADWCRLCWVHVFSGAGLFFELKSESAGPPDPLHATHSSRCPKFASNWSQVGAPSRGVIAIFAANCLFLSLSRWRYVDLNLALSKTLGDPVHSYLISWRWFSRVLRDVFFFFGFHDSNNSPSRQLPVTRFFAEECFKVTPGKGHSVHGSYEADGPSEGLVVKLTTASGKAQRPVKEVVKKWWRIHG